MASHRPPASLTAPGLSLSPLPVSVTVPGMPLGATTADGTLPAPVTANVDAAPRKGWIRVEGSAVSFFTPSRLTSSQ